MGAAAIETCKGCAFFRARKPMPDGAAVLAGLDPKEGKCRRYPIDTQKSADDWCGEFKRRKA